MSALFLASAEFSEPIKMAGVSNAMMERALIGMRNMEAIAVCNTIGNLQSYVTLSIAAMALNETPSQEPLSVG